MGVEIAPEDGELSPDEQVVYSPEFLYMQRVDELEIRTRELSQELADMHAVERRLKAEIREKNELVAHLVAKANAKKGPAFGAAAAVGRAIFVPGGLPHASDAAIPLPPRTGSKRQVRELERLVEETTEDNIRLRNDLQTLAREFRQVLAGGASAVAHAAPSRSPFECAKGALSPRSASSSP